VLEGSEAAAALREGARRTASRAELAATRLAWARRSGSVAPAGAAPAAGAG